VSPSYPGPRFYEEIPPDGPLPSLLRPLARHRALQLVRAHQRNKQELAWRVQDVFAGCGLIQTDYSVACGRVVHIPEVVAVIIGPVARVKIRLLVGQMPEDFTAKDQTLAYHLGAAQVNIVVLEPPFIRLDWWTRGGQSTQLAG
jgi:hypothetical protein